VDKDAVEQLSLGRYVVDTWLPNHVIEATTRQGYTAEINKHILPWFGDMELTDIRPADVRRWVTHLSGLRNWDGSPALCPATICGLKNVLSAIFTTALADQLIVVHPCKGVKTPTVVLGPPPVISSQQFDTIHRAIENPVFRLMIEVGVESGLRWGELTELRPGDIDLDTQILTVSRAVVHVSRQFHPGGGRFLVKQYPKNRDWRRLKLSAEITAKIRAHVQTRGIGRDGLLFEMPSPTPAQDKPVLGYVEGTHCRHGTISGYSGGKCKCDACRRAYAEYRANRRNQGKDEPRRPPLTDDDPHISGHWFRTRIWKPALEAAGIDTDDTEAAMEMHVKNLRHTHASWLLRGGADLQVVKERMGHSLITTTARYLATLPGIDETALDALARVRNRPRPGPPAPAPSAAAS
jgi:integrase